jgi:phage shock protein E
MKMIWQAVFLFAVAISAFAADVSYLGVKPAVIIDVRTPEEFAAGHLDGAVNIPYEQIAKGINTIPSLTKSSPILIYCRSGRRSAIAAQSLEQLGFQRVYDGGGMSDVQRKLQPCSAKSC